MDKIHFQCRECFAKLAAAPTSAGKTIKCPKCGAPVTVDPPLEFKAAASPPAADRPVVDRSNRVITTQPEAPAGPPRSFARRLDTVFAYPFSSAGAIVFLLVVAPFWGVLRSVPLFGCLGLALKILVGGYIAAWMFNVLWETSMGRDRAPGAPGGTDLGELAGYFFRFFGATFVAFAPALGVVLLAVFGLKTLQVSEEGELVTASGFLALLVPACLFGVLYYPMALMLIGFAESWWAGFNYVLGVASIARIAADYMICALFFVVTAAVAFVLEVFWVASTADAALAGKALAAGVTTLIELYLWGVQMRALGLLYLTNKSRLGWFR